MPFSNPIIAGETLVVPGIQSDGYVPATTGWRVEREGNADFNDVDMRGTLDIVGPDYPPNGSDQSRIRILVAGFRPVIQLDDSFGRTYEIGASDNDLYLKALTAPNSWIHIVQDLGIAIRSGATGAPSVLFDDADGLLKVGSYSPWVVDGWQTLTVSSGSAFANNGPEVKKLPDGTCIMRGGISGHSTVVNTTLLTLPVGYRPARAGRWVASAEGTDDTHHIGITTAGVVSIARVGSGGTSGDNDTWFTNVHFSTI